MCSGGFRAPYLEYSKAYMEELYNAGFTYDSSVIHVSQATSQCALVHEELEQIPQDYSNQLFPQTLDYGYQDSYSGCLTGDCQTWDFDGEKSALYKIDHPFEKEKLYPSYKSCFCCIVAVI